MIYTSVKNKMKNTKGKLSSVIKSIKNILKKDTRGLTIKELSAKVNTSRITVSKALMKLEGQGILDIREIGNCKLHYIKNEK